jgi:MFS family permease
MPTATQETVTRLSDFLFFQQPGVIYGIVIAMIAAGVMFWLFGFKLHRLVLSLCFLGAGIWIGWYVGPMYGINALLAMFIGGLLGAGIGYWFFNFWLGIFSSVMIFFILLVLFSWQIAFPYLDQAGKESVKEIRSQGITLAPGASGVEVGKREAPMGKAYRELQLLLPKLSRAQYPDWQSWQKAFNPTLLEVWNRLTVIIPRLSMNMLLLAGVAMIFGCVLALLRPGFLNIAYTSLLGSVLIFCGIGVLMTLKNTDQLSWLGGQYWIIAIFPIFLWTIGIGVQYWLKPAPPPAEEEGEEEEGESDKPKGEKKKK